MDTLREMYFWLERGAILERVLQPGNRDFVMVVKRRNVYRALHEPFFIKEHSTFDDLCAALAHKGKPWLWRVVAEYNQAQQRNYCELIAFAEIPRKNLR